MLFMITKFTTENRPCTVNDGVEVADMNANLRIWNPFNRLVPHRQIWCQHLRVWNLFSDARPTPHRHTYDGACNALHLSFGLSRGRQNFGRESRVV